MRYGVTSGVGLQLAKLLTTRHKFVCFFVTSTGLSLYQAS